MVFSEGDVRTLVLRRAKLRHYWDDTGPYMESLPGHVTVDEMDRLLQGGTVRQLQAFFKASSLVDELLNFTPDTLSTHRQEVSMLLKQNPNVERADGDTPTPVPSLPRMYSRPPQKQHGPHASGGCFAFFARCFRCFLPDDPQERYLLND